MQHFVQILKGTVTRFTTKTLLSFRGDIGKINNPFLTIAVRSQTPRCVTLCIQKFLQSKALMSPQKRNSYQTANRLLLRGLSFKSCDIFTIFLSKSIAWITLNSRLELNYSWWFIVKSWIPVSFLIVWDCPFMHNLSLPSRRVRLFHYA